MTHTPPDDGDVLPPHPAPPPVPMTKPAAAGEPADLGRDLPALLAATKALQGDVAASERVRAKSDELRRKQLSQLRRDGMIMQCLLLVMVLVLGGLLALGYQTFKTFAIMRDCTTPGGDCYNRSQMRTGAAVGALQRIQLYIVECSREFPVAEYPPGPDFDRRFEACVAQRLARQGGATPITPASPRPSPSPTSR